jgi:hypothetical protein
VKEAGLGFMRERGDSGFGGAGFKRSEVLVKAARKCGATQFGDLESAGDAGNEGIRWL